jgi:hypothetical protein
MPLTREKGPKYSLWDTVLSNHHDIDLLPCRNGLTLGAASPSHIPIYPVS